MSSAVQKWEQECRCVDHTILVKIQHRLGHWGTHDEPATLSFILQLWLAEGAKGDWDVEEIDEFVNRKLRTAKNRKQEERYIKEVPSYFTARKLLEDSAFAA